MKFFSFAMCTCHSFVCDACKFLSIENVLMSDAIAFINVFIMLLYSC